jgi:hypothetical protein
MKKLMLLGIGLLYLSTTVYADTPQNNSTNNNFASNLFNSLIQPQPQTQLPPGLAKQNKTPPGLAKKNKTPPGWNKGNKNRGDSNNAIAKNPPTVGNLIDKALSN